MDSIPINHPEGESPNQELSANNQLQETRESYERLGEYYDSVHIYLALLEKGIISEESMSSTLDKAETQDKLMRSFYHDDLNNLAYDAAVLYPLIRALPKRHDEIVELSRRYYNQKDGRYIAGLLLDNAVIDDFIANKTHQTESDKKKSPDYSTTGEHWLTSRTPIKPMEWVKLLDEVNSESVIIRAIDTLMTLEEDAPPSKELFEAIDMAERIYAPLCEIQGFDGLAMTINSRANVLRLKHSGNGHYVQKAKDILSESGISSIGDDPHKHADRIMEMIGFDNVNEAAVKNSDLHQTMMGHGEIEFEYNGEIIKVRYVYREKSVGSLAMKLYNKRIEKPNQDNSPMDIMAFTIIIGNDNEIGPVVLSMAHNIESMDGLEFKKAPSKKHALYVSGDKEYVDNVFNQTNNWEGQLVDVDEKPEKLKVTKATFMYTVKKGDKQFHVPCEVQILTEDERGRTRTGDISHIIYKLKTIHNANLSEEETAEFEKALEIIHSRRLSLSKAVLINTSERRVDVHFKSARIYGEQVLTSSNRNVDSPTLF